MSISHDQHIGLADAIENLRTELTESEKRGKDKKLLFNVEQIEVELAVELVREANVEGGISFKLLGIGGNTEGKAGKSQSNKHTIKIILKPGSGSFSSGSFKVSDHDSKRPK